MEFRDFEQIVRRLYEYAWALDTRDWALLRSVFTDDIDMDFFTLNGEPKSRARAEDWIAGAKALLPGLDATQHLMSNPIVDIDGNRARCRMQIQAQHLLKNVSGDSYYTVGGYYIDTLVKSVDRWLISGVTLNVTWSLGNRQLLEMAQQRCKEFS